MWREPWFWREDTAMARLVAGALSPLGLLYNGVGQAKLRMISPQPLRNCCVVCIGNASLGGVGKTPFAIALAELIRAHMADPPDIGFLTRGYGARLAGPIMVNRDHHGADDVGDEALLLAGHGPVWVSRDRAAGARAAAQAGVRAGTQAGTQAGASMLLADDGYQNPALHKDVSILLVTDPFPARQAIFPAGSWREPLSTAASRADAIIFIHEAKGQRLSQCARDLAGDKLMGTACLEIDKTVEPDRVVAFCGIGHPQRFRNTLSRAGFDVAEFVAFPDHYVFGEHDLITLKRKAARLGARLITTHKDACRLGPEQMADIKILPIKMVIDCPALVTRCVSSLQRKMRG